MWCKLSTSCCIIKLLSLIYALFKVNMCQSGQIEVEGEGWGQGPEGTCERGEQAEDATGAQEVCLVSPLPHVISDAHQA